MKSHIRNFVVVFASVVLLGCGLTASKSNDGYADFDSLGVFDVDHTMTLSFGPTILNFAASHIDDDPETKALLRGLKGVRIKIYEIDGDATRVAARLNKMSLKLREQNWEPIVLVREEGEQVHMLVKMAGNQISGLTILASDAEEVVIVNIMGDLQPEMFTATMAALDIDTPEIQVAVGN